jgi:PTS system nitrogen regulatory IIA component
MVYVHQLLNKNTICFLDAETKSDAINALVDLIDNSPNVTDREAFRKAVFDREAIMSTGLGLGIAIPHVKISAVKDLTIAVGISKKGIEWEALDGEPVHIIFLMAGSEDQHEIYLRTLSKIVLLLKNQTRREKIIAANDIDTVLDQFHNI